MVTHQMAMKLRYNKSTLHRLPPAGRLWKWSDVVGTAEGKVDPAEAHAARPLIERHDDGRYKVTRRLEEYLESQYSIELEGDVMSPKQQTLPTTGDDIVADGSGARVIDTSPSAPPRSNADRVQVDLEGECAEDAVAAVAAREAFERHGASGDHDVAPHQKAREDPGQATLQAFGSVRIGRFIRPARQVYSGPAATPSPA